MSNDKKIHRVPGGLNELQMKGRKVVKLGGRQIALFLNDMGTVYACANRCPHEGFPLVEGSLDQECILTCNWHNWKFDLDSGETLVGGDTLRGYPVEVDGYDIVLDLSDPPQQVLIENALKNLRASFDRHEYDRMAREIARLQQAGGDPLEALRRAVWWTYDHMEFGMTHAYAAAPDWLNLRKHHSMGDAGLELVGLVEPVAHMAWDTQREPVYPYTNNFLAFSPEALTEALEAGDEATAVALVRDGLRQGLGFAEFEELLTRSALARSEEHSHSLIYIRKVGQLLEWLGNDVLEPLLLSLIRSFIYASREDLIPEFRNYQPALEEWDGQGAQTITMEELTGLTVNQALKRTCQSSAHPQAAFHALLGALAWNMAHFDLDVQNHTNRSVSHNRSWLSFTHGLTFANAVRRQCTKFPDLWPQGLLQLSCFLGRQSRYVDQQLDLTEWSVENPESFFLEEFSCLFDHGQSEYIVACHFVKTLTSVNEEFRAFPDAPWVPILLTAMNRFLNSPIKGKHVLRIALQSLSMASMGD
ncbi:MAG: Alkene monooxygenase system, ferredoxin component [Deltaproteobacteria bacterium]|nr:Alkene monooxygenase system, ferredoxin component [Deltaproteobacteria bacterium]